MTDEVTHFFTTMLGVPVPAMVLTAANGPRFLVEFDYADEALDASTEREGRASVFSHTINNIHVALLYKRRKLIAIVDEDTFRQCDDSTPCPM